MLATKSPRPSRRAMTINGRWLVFIFVVPGLTP
jgi:hypothetical protein